MTDFLIKTFIKDSENTNDPAVRSAYGKFAGKTGIICNMALCIGKFFAGIISGSLSITADAVNNLSDASSSIIELMGFKLSERKADAEHPYGHGRYEYLAGLMVAILIIVIGVELLRDSIAKIISPTDIEFGAVTVVIMLVSIPVKLWMMVFNRKIGNIINSEAVKATCADSRNDVITTAVVLASFIISHYSGLKLDGIMGALVAAFILYSGAGLIKDAVNPLLGAAPDDETAEQIRQKILSYDGIIGTHDLMIHDYGPGQQFASAHVEVPAEMSLVECHRIIDKIEHDFSETGLRMLIHPDPIVTGDSDEGMINSELNKIVKQIDERLTVHDVRSVICSDIRKVIFDCVLPPNSGLDEKNLTREINRFMQLKFPDCLCVIRYDYGYVEQCTPTD